LRNAPGCSFLPIWPSLPWPSRVRLHFVFSKPAPRQWVHLKFQALDAPSRFVSRWRYAKADSQKY
jgi:hypothetical protein